MPRRTRVRGKHRWQAASRSKRRGRHFPLRQRRLRLRASRFTTLGCKKKVFQPGVRIWSFSSHGRSHRPLGWTTDRVHHLLSDLEYHVFLILDWARDVVDIREQFPLPLQTTLAIARRSHLSHPWDRKRARYRPVTSDFLYTVRTRHRVEPHVRALKYEEALSEPTQLRSLEIERAYWHQRGIDWKLILHSQIPLAYVANIEWVHPYRRPLSLYPLAGVELDRIQRVLIPMLRRSHDRCCDVTDWCDARMRLPEGTALAMVRYLIANRLLLVDMHIRIIPTNPLIVLDDAQDDFLL
ncbi:putative TnsA endonuclease [Nitrospira lenta]|uniref:Putative TnsA endonuclease n=1 Tax=Nitrospira lenta TaxID=1436998 RepID=A0A330L4C9_9BACT|nr:putative TnsA endonuclease [Nitrospira lenta]